MTDLWSIHQDTGLSIPADVFESILNGQRQRFLDLFATFDDQRWKYRTRCGDWDAHTVFRHLTDATEMQAGAMTGTQPPFAKPMDDFNPQTTPDEWLAHSANETPTETLARYADASRVTHDITSADFRAGKNRSTFGPYGPAHWSVVAVHVLWDSWIHERDIVLVADATTASAAGVSGSAAEQRLCAMYGALMTTVPGVKFGLPLAATLTLTHGDTPLHLELQGQAGAIAAIEHREIESPDLRGELLSVADALAGRGAPLNQVLDGPADLIGGMAILGDAI